MRYKLFDNLLVRIPLLNYSTKIFDEFSLNVIKNNDFIKESLFLGSPELYNEIDKYFKNKSIDKKKYFRLYLAFLRYYTRMSTRCTPFGLFAGCLIAKWGETSNIEVKYLKRKTRLDMSFLISLTEKILEIPTFRNKIKYFSNSSIYSVGNKYRYIEYNLKNNKRYYQITEVESSIYLKRIIKKATPGCEFNELVLELVDLGIDETNAFDFINELIDSQIIQSELSQSITGDDYFGRLIKLLYREKTHYEIISIFEEIKELLDNLDDQIHTIDLYKDIIGKVKSLKIPFDEKYLFQVDTYYEATTATLSRNIAKELNSSILFLNKISPFVENQTLTKFQKDFYSRYEEQEIPLMEAIDSEIGLGYPSKSFDGDIAPLIDDFFIPNESSLSNLTSNNLFQNILLQKTINCISEKNIEIVLTDNDISFAKENWHNLPATFSCMFETLKDNEKGVSILIKYAGGHGANLLSRFSHTDFKIENLVKEITAKEQFLMENIILAEIVHLPESRAGNILSRPHLREYEILYIANSDLPTENLLPVSDLMLSIYQGRLRIRSKKLNKEIIPRLTTAHNYKTNSLPIYHFLCDMQYQNQRIGLNFSWGNLENYLNFRPRVKYKNTILCEAHWKVKTGELFKFSDIPNDKILIKKINEWRLTNSLPKITLLLDGDNELYIDWENISCIRSLLSIIKKRDYCIFKEFLYEMENSVVKSMYGYHINECIAIFYKS